MQFALLIYQGTTPVPTDAEAWATVPEDEQNGVPGEGIELVQTALEFGGPNHGIFHAAPR